MPKTIGCSFVNGLSVMSASRRSRSRMKLPAEAKLQGLDGR